MFNKAVFNYAHSLKFIPDRYKTQEKYIKAVDIHHSKIKYVSV